MTKNTVIGTLRGSVEFWRDGVRVYPENGKVSCTSVRLPSVFVSSERNEKGEPAHTGYARQYVNASDFVRLTAHADRAGGRDVEVPVVMAGYDVEISSGKNAHEYKTWTVGTSGDTRLIAWPELKFVPSATTVSGLDEATLARFTGGVAGPAGFPEVVPVARANKAANVALMV